MERVLGIILKIISDRRSEVLYAGNACKNPPKNSKWNCWEYYWEISVGTPGNILEKYIELFQKKSLKEYLELENPGNTERILETITGNTPKSLEEFPDKCLVKSIEELVKGSLKETHGEVLGAIIRRISARSLCKNF